ncbi:MAG: DUF4430 domain-containing protein [Lachnospiraceae bacterium]
MGRIRNSIVAIICVLVFSLTGCGSDTSSSAGDVSKSKETQSTDENTKSNKKEDSKVQEEIPADLLPAGENEEAEETASDQMEIVEEDGTVHNSKTSGSSKNSSDNKNSSGTSGSSTGSGNSGSSGSGSTQSPKRTIEINFSIDSSKADGSVSYSAVMTLDKGATVYDALAASGVSHSGDSYITAIGGLSEKQFGGQSGWKYYVNGSAPNKSCVDYTLQDGDRVQWSYVLKAY